MNRLHDERGRCLVCSGTGGQSNCIELVDGTKSYVIAPCDECLGGTPMTCPQCGVELPGDLDNYGWPQCGRCGWGYDERRVWA